MEQIVAFAVLGVLSAVFAILVCRPRVKVPSCPHGWEKGIAPMSCPRCKEIERKLVAKEMEEAEKRRNPLIVGVDFGRSDKKWFRLSKRRRITTHPPFIYEEEYGSPPPPKFSVGQWVRVKKNVEVPSVDLRCGCCVFDGLLVRISNAMESGGYYVESEKHPVLYFSRAFLEPALPRMGEVWMFCKCPKHGDGSITYTWQHSTTPYALELLDCGCLTPVRFGFGPKKEGNP